MLKVKKARITSSSISSHTHDSNELNILVSNVHKDTTNFSIPINLSVSYVLRKTGCNDDVPAGFLEAKPRIPSFRISTLYKISGECFSSVLKIYETCFSQ